MYKNRARIPKFGRIRSEFQSLKGQDNNSNVLKIRPEIHYLEGEHQKTDVCKKKPDQEPSVEG